MLGQQLQMEGSVCLYLADLDEHCMINLNSTVRHYGEYYANLKV